MREATPGIRVGAQQVAPYRAALVADIGGDKQLPIIETSDNIPKIKLIGKYAIFTRQKTDRPLGLETQRDDRVQFSAPVPGPLWPRRR